MPGGMTNKPKILHGAFVEFGLTLKPLVVVFQFNPVEITRNRSMGYDVPGDRVCDAQEETRLGVRGRKRCRNSMTSRRFGEKFIDLLDLRKMQDVTVGEESLSFDIRLDATDKLNEGDLLAVEYGIEPQLATLEMMMLPRQEIMGFHGAALSTLLGSLEGESKTDRPKPPMILFIWGKRRVLPVNIDNLSITETEFSTDLTPVRATASVDLTVIEGPNMPYIYNMTIKENMSALNLSNLVDVTDIFIPE